MAEDDRTEAQQDRLHERVSGTRHRPDVRWTDADGEHTVTVDRTIVVGSAPHVDAIVKDAAVSRIHAELEVRDDALWVRDLGSRNGTWVEGVRVSGAQLHDGARVRLGSTTLVARYAATATPVELWPHDHLGALVGRSLAARELFSLIARVAPTDSTVLVQGETGTGKELIAHAIHDASRRAEGPFVVVDCAALPETLLESELFGHARGAFTGAVSARAGAFEQADGGTVFIDEVGELPLPMQPKLLRALESREVRRLGETTARKIDVRIVSATHRDLRTMVNAGAFREDLYFRLAVLPLRVPPLRERIEDIALLAEHFLPAHARGTLTAETLRELEGRTWLGNVRELRNFMERAVALGTEEALRLAGSAPDRPVDGGAGPSPGGLPVGTLDLPFKDVRERWLDHLEREYLLGLLERHGHNVSAVAEASGLNRTYVHRLIRKHDLQTK